MTREPAELGRSNVHKYLDVSTSMLPQTEYQTMQAHPRVLAREYEYGHWVWVPTEDVAAEHDVSGDLPHLAQLMTVARANDCRWINFDRDADPIDGLPTFEW